MTRLKEILDEQGRKQIWIAQRLKVTPEAVSAWVRGVRPPEDKHKRALAKLLGVGVGWLFFGEGVSRECRKRN